MNIKETPNLDILKVSEIFNYPQPIKTEIYENFYTFNEFTSVPYALLSSKSNENKASSLFNN